MSSSRQTLTLAGAILALISGALICSYGSEAKEKTGYQKLLPKLDTAPAPKKLQGKVGMAEILRPNDVGNPWGYLPFGGKLPQTVSQVVPGSPAFAGGLQQSDKILEAQIDKSRAQLVVERAGKKYSCTLTFNDRRTPQKDQPLDSTTARKLADHQIVLLIDSSASMRSKDCPGGSSRWDWCRGQATRLYSDCAEMFKNKISVSTFNSQFSAHANCKAGDLEKIFARITPEGETNMAPVIDDAMRTVNSQIQNGKPAVIAVVTDGRPTDVEPLKNKIKQIANSLRDPGLLTIAFIEIGTPERYLKELDNDLVRQGAKADIVTVFPFTDVNEQGLAKTLARAVTMHAEAGKQSGQPPPPPRQDNRPPRPPPEDGDDRPPPPPPGPGRERPAPGNPPPRFGSGPPRNPGAPGFVEVDEKASVRRKESNRSYDNSSPGSKPR